MRRFILALGLLCSACTSYPIVKTEAVEQSDGKTMVSITTIDCGVGSVFGVASYATQIIRLPEGTFMLDCPSGRIKRFPEDLNKKVGQ